MKKLYLLLAVTFILSISLTACAGNSSFVIGPPSNPASPAEPTTIPPNDVSTTPAPPLVVAPFPTAIPAATTTPTEAATTRASSPAITTTTPRTPTAARPTTPARTTAAVKTAPTTLIPPVVATPVPIATPTPYNGSLTEVIRGKTGKKQVAITLDAGAGSDPFPKMLTALDRANVRITFFLTGKWAQANPTYVQQIVAKGHEIANHSWNHPDFANLSEQRIREEIESTDEFLKKFSGLATKPLWRFPYGSRNGRVSEIVNNLGYRSIMWTIDSLDSVGQPKSAQFLIDRITRQSDAQLDGQIVLMHIGNPTTADALPFILQNLRDRGFAVVTVTELLK